jgi:hypothetical protein
MDSDSEDIPIPPNSTYSTYEEAYNAFVQHGTESGYGFYLQRSRPHHSDIKTRYYFNCDKHGKYRPKGTIRQTGTRTTGCPFNVIIYRDSNQWQLRIQNGYHNHPPSHHPSAHNVFRKRTSSQKESIQGMSQAGVAPKQILTAVRQQDPSTHVTARDIWNERTINRANYLRGRSPIEALLDDLSTSEWIFDFQKDPDNHIRYLFFTHKKQVELLLTNPDILIMDCTYRTNKYGLPLLHILGCTNIQTFFSAGFCFLRNETHQDYYWAISTFLNKTKMPHPRVLVSDQEKALKSAARELLPNIPQLLCVWHINRNVQTKAQHVWRDADGKTREEKKKIIEKRSQFMTRWNQIVYAKNETQFNSCWQQLLSDYSNQQALCNYLEKSLHPIRFEWAAAWTSRYRHFNTITTSPVEGMHKVLKDYLMTSRGDLLRVVERIKAMVENQYSKFQKDIASAQHVIKAQHSFKKMPYLPTGVHNTITTAAIEIIREQFTLYQQNLKRNRLLPCTGGFETINGLPCRHTLKRFWDAGVKLQLDHIIDPHWFYRRANGQSINPPTRPFDDILEPLAIQRRGTPRRSEASTWQELSAVEIGATLTPEVRIQSLPEEPSEQAISTHSTTTTTTSLSIPEFALISTPVSDYVNVSEHLSMTSSTSSISILPTALAFTTVSSSSSQKVSFRFSTAIITGFFPTNTK